MAAERAPAGDRRAHTEERTGRLIVRVARDVRTMVDRRLETLGLTMQQAEVLVWAHRHDELSAADLKPLLFTDDAGVSRLIDRLAAKGLIRRRAHPSDRRSWTLQLTDPGRTLARRLQRIADAGNVELFRGFSPAEVARLRAYLLRIAANARGMERER